MARLYLFAEGQAEQTFAHNVLGPHLAHHGVYMNKPVLIANAHKKQRTHRGGGGNFAAMQKDICRFLRQDRGRDAFFTSMIDLYALHRGFPGSEAAQAFRDDPYRRVGVLEESWANETDDRRCIPHVQLHEYETSLFVNISILSDYYPDKRQAIAELHETSQRFETPELIDDGADTAPSKRIICRLPRYVSDKATVGVQAAERIGLTAIRRKCAHFSQWLERLESLDAE